MSRSFWFSLSVIVLFELRYGIADSARPTVVPKLLPVCNPPTIRQTMKTKSSTGISNIDPPERSERDVYVFFDNTAEGHAPTDARYLMEVVSSD